jgi:hypothetical protein
MVREPDFRVVAVARLVAEIGRLGVFLVLVVRVHVVTPREKATAGVRGFPE